VGRGCYPQIFFLTSRPGIILASIVLPRLNCISAGLLKLSALTEPGVILNGEKQKVEQIIN
jgi:hypothetical protein